MGGRVHVEPDDILDLFGEVRVGRPLEGAQAMRLEAVLFPQPLHGAKRNARSLRHGAAGPVGGGAGRLRAGQFQNPRDDLLRERRSAGLAGLVAQQGVDAFFGVALLPAPHGRPADAGAPGDFQHRQPIGGVQHDVGALNVFERAGAIGGDCLEPLAVFVMKDDADCLSHAPRLARFGASVNPLSVSVH